MSTIYLSLGSNLGDRKQNLSVARIEINDHIGYINKCSSIYETSPWGFESQTNFYNQVISLVTDKKPAELIKQCKKIEGRIGRINKKLSKNYQSRIIDIDILFYDNEIISLEELTIPHPQMHKRLFVLIPLNEIASDIIHPRIKKTIAQLLHECKDKGNVEKIS